MAGPTFTSHLKAGFNITKIMSTAQTLLHLLKSVGIPTPSIPFTDQLMKDQLCWPCSGDEANHWRQDILTLGDKAGSI